MNWQLVGDSAVRPQDHEGSEAGDAELASPEIQFALFLSGLPGKRGHLGKDAGTFLRKKGLLHEGEKLSNWILRRSFLFRIVNTHYVELQQPAAQEDPDAFLDKVGW